MGQFILNGRNYSGITYANGCFIDPSQIITSGAYTGILTYTAIRDCIVVLDIASDANISTQIRIDGVIVNGLYHTMSGTNDTTFSVPLKMRQTLTVVNGNAWQCEYTVYGIQQGTNITFLSEYASACYDTNEREVGCWVDGKPIYQITRAYNNTGGQTVRVSVADLNIDRVVETKLSSKNTPSNQVGSGYYINSGDYLRVYLDTSTNELVFDRGTYHAITSDGFVTILYTKTTDVAGSGKLIPTAMPTVHYDTNEQVIGTFLGKTLYQRTWDITSGILISYNAWTDTSIDSTNMENIVSVKATHPDGTCYEGIMADPTRQNHTLVGLQTTRNGNDARARYVTLQYTKVTD